MNTTELREFIAAEVDRQMDLVVIPKLEALFAKTFGDSWREIPEAEEAMGAALVGVRDCACLAIAAEFGVGMPRH